MEIIVGTERRRRWRIEEKLRIVAETEQPGASVSEVARRHDVSRGLVWNWRWQARRGRLGTPAFLPVRVAERRPSAGLSDDPIPAVVREDRIEIVLADGTVVRAGQDVSLATLRRVLAALRG